MNALYPKWKEALLQGAANSSLTGTVKVQCLDLTLYTYSPLHTFLSDVPVGARVSGAVTLGSKTFVGGVFDAADGTFLAIAGPTVGALALYIDTGADASSRLVAYLDGSANLPFTPLGVDQPFVWDALGIFGL